MSANEMMLVLKKTLPTQTRKCAFRARSKTGYMTCNDTPPLRTWSTNTAVTVFLLREAGERVTLSQNLLSLWFSFRQESGAPFSATFKTPDRTEDAMFRVVIVEDQRILRDGYKDFLKNGPFDVVGEAGDGMAAIKCVLKTNPDMVLLDLSLPKMDGVAVLKEIQRNINRPKVLVLTMSNSDDKIAQAFDNGANGFCLKDTSSAELISAMKIVMSGKRYVSPSIAANVVAGYVHSRATEIA